MNVLPVHIANCALLLRKVLLLACLLPAGLAPARAQSRSAEEHQVKAVFLYNFTQFIDWPQTALGQEGDPFVIGILGEDPFGNYLDDVVAGEKIRNHPIVVKRFKSIREVQDCHMLYVNSRSQARIEEVLSQASARSILTVGDAPQFCKWGGIVRFYTEENKIRIEINNLRAKEAQLNISSKLLSLAKTNPVDE